MTLETTLETRGCAYLILMGAFPVKRGQDGEPDREVLWGGGRHFWIEFKKEDTGRVRPMQAVVTKYLLAIGDEVVFVDTFEQFLKIVDTWVLIYGVPTANRDAAFKRLAQRG